MKLEASPALDTARAEPANVTVQMNLRVPYFYREQLIAEARKRGLSINRLLVNALVASIPPEQ